MGQLEKLLREVYPPQLPYGFAERVAAAALGAPEEGRFWDSLLALSPRTSVAFGLVASALAVLAFVGTAPGLFDAVTYYAQVGDLIALP